MSKELKVIQQCVKSLYEGITDEEMKVEKTKDLYVMLSALRNERASYYNIKMPKAVWYDNIQKEYYLADMMIRSIRARWVTVYDNIVATVFFMSEDRASDKLFVYYDKVENRNHLIYSKEGFWRLIDKDIVDSEIDSLRPLMIESDSMVAYRSDRTSIDIKCPNRLKDALSEWESGYVHMPSMCCSSDKVG